MWESSHQKSKSNLLIVVERVVRLDDWFAEVLSDVRCGADTLAYVTGVLVGFKDARAMIDPHASLVNTFAEARASGAFSGFQQLGDHVLWLGSFCPEAIEDQELVETIGRQSYLTCYRLLDRQWQCYEELADELPVIIYDVRTVCRSLRTPDFTAT